MTFKGLFLRALILTGLGAVVFPAGVWGSGHKTGGDAGVLVVMTHDSFNISRKVMDAFEARNHVKVKFLKAGDAGAALNQAILSKNNPMADVFFGVDNTFLSRALDAGLFEPHHSPALEKIPETFRLDKQNRLLPIDFGDVCLNYDIRWLAGRNIPPPAQMADLIKPEYKGLVVVQNPATSSPGLAFLLATISRFGESGYLDFWKKLKKNKVLATNGWNDAYWGHFTAASKGSRPIVVSYATSPAAEVHFSPGKKGPPPTAALTGPGDCFRQIEFAGILKGARNPKKAGALIDFMLAKTFQENIPLSMFVFPTHPGAALPEVFEKYARMAEQPGFIPYERIAEKRMEWIEAWTREMLR
ncbi:Thiamine ABC transporter substrate-binding protein [Candidatus Desulfarcum epimagneticum]|uniref:Thiamine ABC transporter substrate-binding protein n=1 Tax=uncultured Desulfobacteraceae bacterium TaxID=218296 RepID=A0A484HIC1_9BACT|nr:Thiamine ABC transporter substrate-binding protein [uncultured Desulfobacteraceae bacterium]